MKLCTHPRAASALSRTDVLVVVATVALLAIVLLTPMGQRLLHSRQVTCVSNLKQVGLGFRLWSNDSSEKFPWGYTISQGGVMDEPVSNLPWRVFQVCSNELNTTRLLVCPRDSGRSVARNWNVRNPNISYFVGLSADDSDPASILTGDRNLESAGALLSPGQHDLARLPALDFGPQMHKRSGYVGLADGSASLLTKASLTRAVTKAAANQTNVFVVVP